MGGGDLNMKKSWHPLLLKNQERVWLEEKKALEEKKKLDQLRKEKEEERQLQELQRMQEEQTGKKRQEKLEWMYTTPATGNNQNPNDLEDYLLGKKRVDKMLTADDNAKLGASHKNFIAVQNANTARDVQAKIREDPLLAIKQQEQAAYQAVMSNPLRLREMQERNGIKPKKDKRERKREKEERKRLKAERKHRRGRDSRSPSPRDQRFLQSPRDGRRSISPDRRRSASLYERRPSSSPHERRRPPSPYDRRRSPRLHGRRQSSSPYARRSESRDRQHHRLPRNDGHAERSLRRYSPQPRRRSDSESPIRDDRGWKRDRYADSSRSDRRSRSPRPNRFSPPQSRAPPPLRQSHQFEKDARAHAEDRAARLAAMTSSAINMQDERKQRLAQLLEKEKAELAREELERAKSAKSGGIGEFMSSDYKKVYSGEGGLEDRIRRSRGTLVID